MRIIVEEIIKAHPAGTNAGGYLRAQRVSPIVDEAAALLLVDNDATELWITSHGLGRRCVNILTHRVVADDSEVMLIVDVATQEICNEILPNYERGDGLNEGAYIAWAIKNRVWP